jgi:hypothetical protein
VSGEEPGQAAAVCSDVRGDAGSVAASRPAAAAAPVHIAALLLHRMVGTCMDSWISRLSVTQILSLPKISSTRS